MDATERPEERAQSSTSSFTRVAVDFPHAVAIGIARPLLLSVIDRRVLLGDPMITPILVRIHNRLIGRDGFRKNALTGGLITVCDHPTPFFARLPADDVNDWRPIVVVGTLSWPFIRPAARRIIGIEMRRTFFLDRQS